MFPCPATLCRRYHTTKPIQIYCLRCCLWSPASWASDAGHLFGCFEILLQAVTKSMEIYGLALYQNIILSRYIKMHHALSMQYTALRTPTLPTLQAFYILFLLCPIGSHSLDVRHWGLVGFLWRGARLGAWISGNSDGPDLRKLAASSVDPGPTGGLLYQFHISWGVDPIIINYLTWMQVQTCVNPVNKWWETLCARLETQGILKNDPHLTVSPYGTQDRPIGDPHLSRVAADCWTRRCGSVQMAELFWKPRKMTRWPLGHWGLKCRHYMTTPWHAWAGQWCRETVEVQKRRGWFLKLFYRNSVDSFFFIFYILVL